MKEARGIHSAGKVSGASYQPPLLTGRVGELHCGLRIRTRSDIENLCSCADSRRRGIICAHSIAVGLEIIAPSHPSEPPPVISKVAPPKPDLVPAGPDAPEILLHVILPPSLASAWRSDGITVMVEAEAGKQRRPFGSLPPQDSWRCDVPDQRFLNCFLTLTGGVPATAVTLTRSQFGTLLSALAGHPRITFGRSHNADIGEEGLRPVLRVRLQKDAALLLECTENFGSNLLVCAESAWLMEASTLRAVAPGLPGPYLSVLRQPVTIPAPAVEEFRRGELPNLAAFFEITGLEALPSLPVAPPPPPPPPPRLRLEGSLNFLAASFLTNPSAECTERLLAAGFSGPDKSGQFALKGESQILRFFASALPRLEREWNIEIGERFAHVTRDIERISQNLEVRSSGEDWFDLSCALETPGGEQIPDAEIHRLLRSGQCHLRKRDGRTLVFDSEMLEDFASLLQDSGSEQRSPGLYRMNRRQAGSMALFASDAEISVRGEHNWKDWTAGVRSPAALAPPDLGHIAETLRPYQKLGVAWMHSLASHQFGGILADEMGLGKTLQTLAFLQSLRGQGPCLIVCPTSLVFNWQAEARQWTPGLQVLALEGPGRDAHFGSIASADLVLTSYALLRLDIERLKRTEFAAVILDEAQHIKNPDSQNAKAATALQAKHRFALTGTPVENSVRDIWSLMHFLLPGYLGSRTEFRERYERPISSQSGCPEQVRLSRRLRPFLLRRTKQLVATELPAKIEQVIWCELQPAQRAIYEQLASAARRQLSELAGAKDRHKARMLALTALLRLRQAACDARLTGMEDPPEDQAASGKLELLMELLEEAVEGGHRILVFSQFVAMLQHIRSRLSAASMNFCYLDGQSRDRAGQVQRFQAGDAPVFLISLKAGGTGLNLTAADTVVHFDPWWNPAVEAQATDRAHRIGQNRVVTSYKLITRGTVEEKILALQQRKKAVIAATLESEQPMMSGLSHEEIAELLG